MNYIKMAKYFLKLEKRAFNYAKRQKYESKNKSEHDIVTSYDFIIEKYIIDNLKKKYGDVKILSEELNPNTKPEGTFFVIDPIDGTINFSCGIKDFGVQMAYVENGELMASAIYLPYGDDYYAVKNAGAYKNGKRFFKTDLDLQHSLFIFFPEKDNFDIHQAIFDKALCPRHIQASCLEFTRIAEGKYGLMVSRSYNIYDVYPGLLIALEAGCCYERYGEYNIYANNQTIVDEVKAIIDKCKKNKKSNNQTKSTSEKKKLNN